MTNPSFTADIPAKVDSFKRKPFAIALAKSLCLDRDMYGLVVGIEGEWGAGKTSIINFIKDELKTNKAKPIVIEFNPWLTSGSKDLVEIMLTQLASALGAGKTNAIKGMNTAEKIVQYAGLLKYLKYLPALSWVGNIAEDATNTASDAVNNLRALVPNLDLSKSKQEVEKSLRSLNKPIIVIIDDLDRLTHSEVRHLFQAIKSVADFPRVTYLLAYDLKLISSALDKEFGEKKGLHYIEKIVQISYPVPVIMPLQMLTFTNEKLEGLFSRLSVKLKPYEEKYWNKALNIIIGLQKNPRDLIRLVNRLVIAIPNTRTEINICDVIVLEAIGLKFPYLRTVLHQNPELFTGRFWINNEDGTDFDWSQYIGDDKEKNKQKWIDKLPAEENDKKSVANAFKFLFPKLSTDSLAQDSVDELRITATDRLQRYFALTTLDNSVEVGQIHNLLRNPELLEACLNFNSETIDQQLSDINCYIGSAEINDIESISEKFFDKTQDLFAKNKLTRNRGSLISNILIRLIIKEVGDKKKALFLSTIKELPLSVNTELLKTAISDLNLWPTGNGNLSENPLIDDKETIQTAQTLWLDRITAEIEQSDFLNYFNAKSLVWCWWHLNGDRELILAKVKSFFSNQKTIELAAKRFLDRNGFMDINEFNLIWNPTELEQLLREVASVANEYQQFIDQLSLPDVLNWHEEREKAWQLLDQLATP